MTVYLPDTNVLIDALNGRRGQKELLRDLVLHGHRLAGCAVTIAELFTGVHKPDLPKVEEFVSALVWHETTFAVAKLAGKWRGEYARQGVTLGLADTLIAATAVEYGLTLISGNRKHFPMPELQLYPSANTYTLTS